MAYLCTLNVQHSNDPAIEPVFMIETSSHLQPLQLSNGQEHTVDVDIGSVGMTPRPYHWRNMLFYTDHTHLPGQLIEM